MSFDETIVNCRACTRECNEYKALHAEEMILGERTTLASLLNYCTNLDLDDDSIQLPKNICMDCTSILEQSYSFKKMVLESNELLQQGLTMDENYVMVEMLSEVEEYQKIEAGSPQHVEEEVIKMEDELIDPGENEEFVERVDIDSLEEAEVEYIDVKNEIDEYISEVEISQDVGEIYEEDEEYEINYIQEDDPNASEGELKTDNAGDGHICSVCGKIFRQRCRLRQHMRSHNDQKQFICGVCGKKLKHWKNYKEHIVTHTEAKPYQCNVCERYYRSTSSLAAHKRTHATIKPYKCDDCGRGFAAFDHMRRHRLTHTGERPYACNLCDKAYYDSSSLRTHMVSHTGVKAFTCEICGLGLTQKSGYKKHMLVHTGEKPHKCPICGRCFTFTSNLNAHVRLHSGEKPFKCDNCNKCFPTKKRLQSHQRVHTKDRENGDTTRQQRTGISQRGQRSLMPDALDHKIARSRVVVVI